MKIKSRKTKLQIIQGMVAGLLMGFASAYATGVYIVSLTAGQVSIIAALGVVIIGRLWMKSGRIRKPEVLPRIF